MTKPRRSLALLTLGALLSASAALGSAGPASTPPQLITAFAPTYPDGLRRQGIEGVVVADILVSAEGRCNEAWPVAYSNSLFAAHAVDSLRKWRFRPATQDGHPAVGLSRVPVVFQLRGQSTIAPFGNDLAQLQKSIDQLFRTLAGPGGNPPLAGAAPPGADDRVWFCLSAPNHQILVSLAAPSRAAEDNEMLADLRQELAARPPSPEFLDGVGLYQSVCVSAVRLQVLRPPSQRESN